MRPQITTMSKLKPRNPKSNRIAIALALTHINHHHHQKDNAKSQIFCCVPSLHEPSLQESTRSTICFLAPH
ncbi:hypothetical protein L1887_01176 [Cichorium endivia]|nr:hypothetical protein L1887_01176 [Cichorium endivia]